ncbi:hypothetical protein [Nocardia cyriacigeorgica]|uniref:Holin n=1 Tax=Nocardia cyriacigeorgica TaxID=135487 RepID=A0A5R8NB38_9NOCA|nr:hypothetical protein [Nocardia cyriacigeorgica]TLF72932.1 hypothetical protein FEK34_28335 [Nocardia cyriacigeorgica]
MGRHSLPEDATQVRYPWRTTVRTVFQLVVGIAAALPMIVAASGLPETAAGVGVALGVAAAITRLMSLPAVNGALAVWLPWLAAEPKERGMP